MKKIRLKTVLIMLTALIVGFQACKHKDDEVTPAPSITAFAPTAGVAGTAVTITGSNFGATTDKNIVTFAGTAATVTAATPTQVTVTVPAGAATGKITVSVGSATATSSTDFTIVLPPTVASFAPTSALAGASVIITGTNFSTTLTDNVVKFNGMVATVTAATATQLTVTVPVGATSGKISVGTVSSATDFTVLQPTITGFNPVSGVVGATVTIMGTNFSTTLASNVVKFNGTVATVTAATATQLTVTVPVGASTGKITVGAIASTADFTVNVLMLTDMNPTHGPKLSQVIINGTNFDPVAANNTVTFNNVAANVVSLNAAATQLTVTVPQSAGTGSIAVTTRGTKVTLTTPFVYELTATSSVFAGSGAASYLEGTGTAAAFNDPVGLAIDGQGNLYVADYGNNRIRKITPQGVTSLVAGNSTPGYLEGTGAGATFNGPVGLAFDAQGNLYVTELDGNRIRKVVQGTTSLIAGDGTANYQEGAGNGAQFNNPFGITVDAQSNLYVADFSNHRIRKITPLGVTSLVAGDGTANYQEGTGAGAEFNHPIDIKIDGLGNLYVSDYTNNRIRKVTTQGVTSLLAGDGTFNYQDGTGAAAQFATPDGLVLDSNGNLLVADRQNNLIRKVSPLGVTTTITTVDSPNNIAVDAQGRIYVSSGGNNKIYKITFD